MKLSEREEGLPERLYPASREGDPEVVPAGDLGHRDLRLLARLDGPLRRALRDAETKATDIDEVLLVGGAMVPWPVVALLLGAPLASGLLQLGLSRAREYEADKRAVELTGDPHGLASALLRMERQSRGLLQRLLGPRARVPDLPLLKTHPDTEDRVRRLLDSGAVSRYPRRAQPRFPIALLQRALAPLRS